MLEDSQDSILPLAIRAERYADSLIKSINEKK